MALIALTFAAYFIYPWTILLLYGKDIPTEWSSNIGEMSFQQIYDELGSPDESATAKDYQSWVERKWWGVKLLKVIASDCCKTSNKPDEVIYIVYVNGRYAPIYQETLFSKSD